MWALGQILTQVPDEAQREQILTDLDTLVDRSGGQLLEQVDTADGLPPPSADYWEHRESQLTLGTAAPVLAGLHGVAGIWAETSDPRAAEAQEAAGVLHAAIEAEFGPEDRKSIRLNSSHVASSYAVVCLKKKNESLIQAT